MRMITLGLFGAALAAALAAGCGDDDDDNPNAQGKGGASGSAGASGAGGSGGASGAGGSGGAGGTAGAGGGGDGPTVLASFDRAKGQLVEGIALRENKVYVGYAGSGEVVTVPIEGGAPTAYAKFPAPVEGKGFFTGIAFDGQGNLYGALASFDPAREPGVYRVGSGGGEATVPFVSNKAMVLPNWIAFDGGKGYVTDSADGTVFRFDPAGKAGGDAEAWVTDDLLKGDPLACGGKADGLNIGVNGLVIVGNDFYVVNTNKGTVVRVPRDPGTGDAGRAELILEDCEKLAGIDGVVPDGRGGLYAAVNAKNSVVQIDLAARAVRSTVAAAPAVPLDAPASLASEGGFLYVTNAAFFSTNAPTLMRLPLGPTP